MLHCVQEIDYTNRGNLTTWVDAANEKNKFVAGFMESYKEATDAQLLDKPQIKEIIHEFFNTLGIHGGSKETASRIKK